MSKYSQSTVQLINTLVKPEMPTYDYDEETVTIDGVKAKKQILTVHKDSKTQIVEYTCSKIRLNFPLYEMISQETFL